ncbi:hypothetical protein Hanom_Chr16g01515531 [Helianthus anomalus]
MPFVIGFHSVLAIPVETDDGLVKREVSRAFVDVDAHFSKTTRPAFGSGLDLTRPVQVGWSVTVSNKMSLPCLLGLAKV